MTRTHAPQPQDFQSKRCLVTGASGFVGANLVRRLSDMGAQVLCILRSRDNWRLHGAGPRIQRVYGSLADRSFLNRVVADFKPQRIFHLATHGAYHQQNDPQAIFETNVLGSWQLLMAARQADVELFVNVGSSSEYGFKDGPMAEVDVLRPNSYYSVTKACQTLLGQQLALQRDLPVVGLRLFSVYGPYEEPTRLVPTVLKHCHRQKPLSLVSPDTARDFVYVDDVIDLLTSLDPATVPPGEVFNVGSGRQTTIEELVECAFQVTGTRVPCEWGAMEARRWDSQCWQADMQRTHVALGWQASSSLHAGLLATWRKFRQLPSIFAG